MSSSQAAVNHWPDNSCARTFWGQKALPPYRRLLSDTVAWLDPRPGQRWLDLGCGGGQLTRALWEKSEGSLAEVVALDCAAANESAIAELRPTMSPPAPHERVRFLHADFSSGLDSLPDASFDGAVSGLAIQYAESFNSVRGWTTDAYEHLLREVRRVLHPGGTFVFSVNKPDPSWGLVALAPCPASSRRGTRSATWPTRRACGATAHGSRSRRAWPIPLPADGGRRGEAPRRRLCRGRVSSQLRQTGLPHPLPPQALTACDVRCSFTSPEPQRRPFCVECGNSSPLLFFSQAEKQKRR